MRRAALGGAVRPTRAARPRVARQSARAKHTQTQSGRGARVKSGRARTRDARQTGARGGHTESTGWAAVPQRARGRCARAPAARHGRPPAPHASPRQRACALNGGRARQWAGASIGAVWQRLPATGARARFGRRRRRRRRGRAAPGRRPRAGRRGVVGARARARGGALTAPPSAQAHGRHRAL
ncbi:MAG: hypothetical protein J3K34DRAFT_89759 [Monoraphidium minutum]|nr:MAG: hypothetical protein J3K34DRAFT_89759 [Monoraphidium minutum]